MEMEKNIIDRNLNCKSKKKINYKNIYKLLINSNSLKNVFFDVNKLDFYIISEIDKYLIFFEENN
jgi:hypothetical protein